MAKKTLDKPKVFTKPDRGSVAFSKIRFMKDGGIEVEFQVGSDEEDGTVLQTHKVTAPGKAHPDLERLKGELKPFIAMNYQITTSMAKIKKQAIERAFDFIPANKQAEFKELMEQDDTDARKTLYQSIEVTGISFSGEGNFEGGKISGKIIDLYGGYSAMNSARIPWSSDKMGFETEVQRIFDDIADEAYEYLFNGKRAQLELFSNKPPKTEGGEE